MQIEKRSDSVQEIMSAPPRWITRWGSTLLLFIFAILLLLSYLVRFPDEIQAHITIKSTTPPREVVPKVSGQLQRLLVRDQENVASGQTLAVIESNVEYEDVVLLDSLLSPMLKMEMNELARTSLPDNLKLGEMQAQLTLVVQSLHDLRSSFKNQPSEQNFKGIDNQVENIELIKVANERERSKVSKLLKLAKSQLAELKENKGAEKDVENAQNKILELERQFEAFNRNILQNEQQIDMLQQSKKDRQFDSKQNNSSKFTLLQEQMRDMKDKLARWKYRYLLTAPVSGQVVFLEVWDDRQYIQAGEAAIAVKPEQGKMYGMGKLPSLGSGKVQKGQAVIIKLESYPFQEFGVVRGVVEKTSIMPSNKQHIVEVSLPKGLLTSQNKELKFKEHMEGRAEIQTQNRRVIAWVFEQFFKRN